MILFLVQKLCIKYAIWMSLKLSTASLAKVILERLDGIYYGNITSTVLLASLT